MRNLTSGVQITKVVVEKRPCFINGTCVGKMTLTYYHEVESNNYKAIIEVPDKIFLSGFANTTSETEIEFDLLIEAICCFKSIRTSIHTLIDLDDAELPY